MSCDCLSPVSSVSRSNILRSASVNRIVVFSKVCGCRMTRVRSNTIAKIVWRAYGACRKLERI